MMLKSISKKALSINKTPAIYGSFAEIGAGQEVANHFFKAGLASQTIAKSMSAYDMTFSDEIYGKQDTYVCKKRLVTMLNHEYKLLNKRLKQKQGKKSCFFALATTAATSSKKIKNSSYYRNNHAWVGLRFQTHPLSSFNDFIFHVHCLDKSRLEQHEAIGILGVNLIYACFKHIQNPKKHLFSLRDHLKSSRVQINNVDARGKAFRSASSILLNKWLLDAGHSPFVFLSSLKEQSFIGDVIFKKQVQIIYGDKEPSLLFKTSAQKIYIYACPYDPLFSENQLKKKIRYYSNAKNSYLLMTPYPQLKNLKKLLNPYVFDKGAKAISFKKN